MDETTPPRTTQCVYCRQKTATSSDQFWPFCSERCKLMDLGRWATGDYSIPCQNLDDDMITELEKAISDTEQQDDHE